MAAPRSILLPLPIPPFLQISGPFGLSLASLSLELFMLLPILLLSAAGFTVLTTEFIIVGLLPALRAKRLKIVDALAGR